MCTLKVALAPSSVASALKIISPLLNKNLVLIQDFSLVPRRDRCQVLGNEDNPDTIWLYLYDWQSAVSLAILYGSIEQVNNCKSKLLLLRAGLNKSFALNKLWQKVCKPAGETLTSIIPCKKEVPICLLTKIVEKTKCGTWRYYADKSLPPFNRSFSQWLLKDTGIKTPMRFEHSGKENGEYYIYVLLSVDTNSMSPSNIPMWREIENKLVYMESL